MTITGTDLADATRVTFGSAGAPTSFTVDIPHPDHRRRTHLRHRGRRHIRITTPDGTSPTVHRRPLHLHRRHPSPPSPHITPATGPRAGGTEVTITGTDLTDTTRVTFGSTGPATASPSTHPPRSPPSHPPPSTAGRRHLRIRTPAGNSAPTRADVFTYN